MFTDPFGFKADTLDFKDAAAEAAFADCRANSACSKSYATADGMAGHIGVRLGKPGEKLPGGKLGGYTRLKRDNGGAITSGEMIIQPEDFATTSQAEGVSINLLSVTSHELGHVAGTAQLPAGTWCAEQCAIKFFENPAREAAGMGVRPYVPAIHGP